MDTPQNIHVINANMKHPYIYIYIFFLIHNSMNIKIKPTNIKKKS